MSTDPLGRLDPSDEEKAAQRTTRDQLAKFAGMAVDSFVLDNQNWVR